MEYNNWEEMSYNKYNYNNKNRFELERYDKDQDDNFDNKYGLDTEYNNFEYYY